MKEFWKKLSLRHLSKKFLWITALGSILFSALIFLFLYSFGRVLDTDLVKKFITEQVFVYTDLEIVYNDVDTILFPLPGFTIQELSLKEEGREILTIRELELIWNAYALLKGEFELTRVYARDSYLRIKRNEEGNITFIKKIDTDKMEEDSEDFRKKQSEDPSLPLEVLQMLPTQGKIENFRIDYKDEVLGFEDTLLWEDLSYRTNPSDLEVDLHWKVISHNAEWNMEARAQFLENRWDPQVLRYEISTKLKNGEFSPYKDLLKDFHTADFDKTKLEFDILLKKEDENIYQFSINSFQLTDLKAKKKDSLPPIDFSLEGSWDNSNQNLSFSSINFRQKDRSDISAKGSFRDNLLDVELSGKKFHLASIIQASKLFTENRLASRSSSPKAKNSKSYKGNDKDNSQTKSQPQKPFRLNAKLNLNHLNLNGTYLQSVKGKVNTEKDQITWKDIKVVLYGGKIVLSGNLNPSQKGQNFRLQAVAYGVESEYLLESVTKQKLLKGKLHANIAMTSRIASGANFMNYLNLDSKVKIQKGELLGYANFIRPVAEIGKLINFQDNSGGKSTSFNEIRTKVKIQSSIVYLKEFQMDGVGIDAKGSGTYNIPQDKMDMKFQASLAGAAGKAFKIPIIYKGVLGKNVAYLDPVWLASVYAGTIFFAGPAGAVVGGLTGSLASDTVEKTTDTVKDGWNSAKDFIWGSGDKKNDGKNKK